MSLLQPLIGAGALVAVALISFLGARLASRDTRKASTEAAAVVARIDERKVDLDEFRELKTELREQLDDARERINTLEATVHEEQTARQAAERRATAAEERAEKAEQRAASAEHRAARLEETSGAGMRRLARRVELLESRMRAAGLDPDQP